VAQSPILTTTITLERLAKRGYESMLDYYLKVYTSNVEVFPHYLVNRCPDIYRDETRTYPDASGV